MAFNPDNPETKPVYTPDTRKVDTFFVTSVTISLSPTDELATTIHVEWLEGFMDGSSFTGSERKTADLSGLDLLKAMNEPVNPALSHYDDFRNALWAFMQQQGIIPPGKVT